MERKDDEAPFPGEPWRRLLEESADGPPEATDARIRAAARRDLAPRGRRWWLPASLAASLVLAVMIVHSQFGTVRRAPMTESNRIGDPAMDARPIDHNDETEAREAGESPAAALTRDASPARDAQPAEDYSRADPDTGSDPAGPSPRVGGPERELKAASEPPGEAAAGEPPPEMVTAAPSAPLPPQPAAPAAAASRSLEAARSGVAADAAGLATPPTPEAWYTAIEKLRAEGRDEEAERELLRLRQAYPGWLEKHLEEQARR
jgi:hypothetical protein